jgi:hypothetical protein
MNKIENLNKAIQSIIIIVIWGAIAMKCLIHWLYFMFILNIILQIYFYYIAIIKWDYVLWPIYRRIKKLFNK